MKNIAVAITCQSEYQIFETERLKNGFTPFEGQSTGEHGYYKFTHEWGFTAFGCENIYLQGYQLLSFKEFCEKFNPAMDKNIQGYFTTFDGKDFPMVKIRPQNGLKRDILDLVHAIGEPLDECSLTDFLMALQYVLDKHNVN